MTEALPRSVTSPRGEVFEVEGRAPRPPSPPGGPALQDDWLVLEHGALFACSDAAGDIDPGHPALGLYRRDTRFLSELRLTVDGATAAVVDSSETTSYEAVIEWRSPEDALQVQRRRLLGDRAHEVVRVHNRGRERLSTALDLILAADFADIFEVRGVAVRPRRGLRLSPRLGAGRIDFGYVGEDEIWRLTSVGFSPAPDRLERAGDRVKARWTLQLAPGAHFEVESTVRPAEGDEGPVEEAGVDATRARVERDRRTWVEQVAAIDTDDEVLARVLQTAEGDVWALMSPMDDRRIPAAGVPWYVAPFGRDALITSLALLPLTTVPARDTLLLLAARQASRDDAAHDAEPGKILHELRYGELARAALIPQTPYFGTADATPLFVLVAAAYHRWTGDLETMTRLRPHLDAALAWIGRHGDRDGDGFVEYECRAPGGLVNQGWKDSASSVVHADGSLAEGPIALCEVQAYVYAATRNIAAVYDELGDAQRAAELGARAEDLRDAFDAAFWIPEEGAVALALDGAKRRVGSITSNAAHCLFAGIVKESKAPALVERLMAPDMFSGWGLRTLSAISPAYDPTSYHNGSVWPHDSALGAAGFKAYGFEEAASAVADALLDAAAGAPGSRLPELFTGHPREGPRPVSYPAACRPQAWAAVTPVLILQTLLGLSADAARDALVIERPRLPGRTGRIDLHGVRVGASRYHFRVERAGARVSVTELRREGPRGSIVRA